MVRSDSSDGTSCLCTAALGKSSRGKVNGASAHFLARPPGDGSNLQSLSLCLLST